MQNMERFSCLLPIFALFLAIFVQPGTAIMCHVCNSSSPGCGDPFEATDNKYLINCNGTNPDGPEPQFCRKIDQTVKDDRRIFRRCAWEPHERRDCYFGASEYYKAKICICREDGCNSATALQLKLGAVVTTLIAAMVFSIFNVKY